MGNRANAWVPYEGIKAAKPEMLCKTRIVFSDEYSVTGIPNRAMADETPRPNYNGTPFSLGISHQYPQSKGFAVRILAIVKI